MYYASFQALDLALATTLSFSSQIFVIILATLCLGERLTARRLGATLLGIVGIAIAVRLWGVQSIDGRALYGLTSAFLGAVMLIITRSLSQTERTQTIMLYIGVIVFLAAVPQAASDWRPLAGRDVALLAAMGLLGSSAMWLMVEAYRYAEASSLAPFPYLRLVFSALVGAIFFGETILPETFVGAGLIVASAIVIISEPKNKAHNPGRDRARLESQWKERTGNEQR
jgi:drug/metabolite transporter (DMT)-like permease